MLNAESSLSFTAKAPLKGLDRKRKESDYDVVISLQAAKEAAFLTATS